MNQIFYLHTVFTIRAQIYSFVEIGISCTHVAIVFIKCIILRKAKKIIFLELGLQSVRNFLKRVGTRWMESNYVPVSCVSICKSTIDFTIVRHSVLLHVTPTYFIQNITTKELPALMKICHVV